MHFYPIVTFLLFFALNTCEDQTTEVQSEITTLYIHHQLIDCEGVGPQQCMQIKENQNAEWNLFYSTIEGFDFQEGYQYTIEVEITPVENPMADASSLRYQLIKIISKEKVSGDLLSQENQPEKISYKAFTRGFTKEISISNKRITKKENQQIDTLSINEINWLALQTLLIQSEPVAWETITPPSTEYQSDAGFHTTLSAYHSGKQYTTQTFDEHNPPEQLVPLINELRTLAKDKE
ncbi:DUF4377 domain-containing protein [Aquimarina sp. ERC-38]|uniref:DUF4377 domain-containing protein n=1 Tax=Aquimarina sp. ERC-38 TaxID=2949996 RepID=UPI00224819CC|nr:DUF4377 domain-containing protein [Aquimarina sp. ERC-38]UZO81804.1 DUF4377 domain-containing protein [Aquimarina sp. ERC-38]